MSWKSLDRDGPWLCENTASDVAGFRLTAASGSRWAFGANCRKFLATASVSSGLASHNAITITLLRGSCLIDHDLIEAVRDNLLLRFARSSERPRALEPR
jgi:hypothetical protein